MYLQKPSLLAQELKFHGNSQGYEWPGLVLQAVFCQPCKTTTVHYRSMEPLRGTNKAMWCIKLCLNLLG